MGTGTNQGKGVARGGGGGEGEGGPGVPVNDDGNDRVAQHDCHTPNNMRPWFTVFFDIGHSCYDQLTRVTTRRNNATFANCCCVVWTEPKAGVKRPLHMSRIEC